ncbi:MAG: TadE family protein [Bryobacterales bacterium]|nr:TadE family protein [Bryobacterales bacterium]
MFIRRRGSAVVEAALMMPWIVFLFIGVFDFGFYAYASIATQNAARAAAIQVATGLTDACAAARGELGVVPNVVGVSTCEPTPATVDNTHPVAVCTGVLSATTSSPCGLPTAICADCAPAICAAPCKATSIQAVVTYITIPLLPIPGILTGQMRLTRIAEMRILEQ